MEKYRSTADPSTGIHPFLPPPPATSLLGLVLVVVRAPLLLLCLLVYAVLSTVAAVTRPAQRAVDIVLLPPLLLALSVWRAPAPSIERPRTRAAATTTTPGPGDVIVASHASPLDILYLARFYSPVFVTIASDGRLVRLSLLSALRCMSCAPHIPDGPYTTCTNASAPVVLLAEGCRTNGKGILKFAVSLPDILPTQSAAVYALAFSYSAMRRECSPLGGLTKDLVHLITALASRVRVRVTRVAPDTDIQRTLASLAGVPALGISRDVGPAFLEHYRQQHKQ